MKIFLLFILISTVVKAQEFNKDPLFGFIYQQKEFATDDAQGDLSLCLSIWNTGVKQIGDLLKLKLPQGGYKDRKLKEAIEKYPTYLSQFDSEDFNYVCPDCLDEAQPVDESRKKFYQSLANKPDKIRPIYVKSFVRMLMQVILEEEMKYPPQMNEIHEWSKENKKALVKSCPIALGAPKLLFMLATGVSSRFAKTFKENALAEMIKQHPIRSLYPHDVFRMSYRLNEGNVYLALLTIENLFSEFWSLPEREARIVTTRLAHITNDPENDNFGTWYHLFGVMVFGYAHGSLKSWGAGVVEAIGSGIQSGFKAERQENMINHAGARIGGRLRKELKRKLKGRSKLMTSELDLLPQNYLNLLELK